MSGFRNLFVMSGLYLVSDKTLNPKPADATSAFSVVSEFTDPLSTGSHDPV